MFRISRLLGTLLAGSLLIAASAGAESRLRPVAALPEERLAIVADASARALDQVRAARDEIATRRTQPAGRSLAQARNLLAQARAASPATAILEGITAAITRLEDPTRVASVGDVDGIFAEVESAQGGRQAGDTEAFSATKRYLERARYQIRFGSVEAAIGELVSAAARVPFAEIDAPLAAAFARVSLAAIELQAGRSAAADAILFDAEHATLTAVRIANGEALPLPDVAAERPAPTRGECAITESEIPASSEFQEPEPEAREPGGDGSGEPL